MNDRAQSHPKPQPSRAADKAGRLGLPAPLATLTATPWDAIVVGAGHNGLSCAAYLARAGKRVLVVEARERVGGACTIDEPWPGYRVSPCAYLLGLLHPKVIDELRLLDRGLRWIAPDSGLFVPFDDGSSLQLWDDDAKCEAELRKFAPTDLDGWRRFGDVKRRLRDALRPADGERDVWLGPPPSREDLEHRLRGDEEALGLLFDWSMVHYVERFFRDERLQSAYLGQGVIGTNASPHDPGTAYIHFHHQCGRLGGIPGQWGYVVGGMGMVSMTLADAARDLGALIATDLPVAQIVPGQGVVLEGGDRIDAPLIVSNADPRTTLNLLGDNADPAWRTRVESIPMTGCTVKLNVALRELPNFRARPGVYEPHHLGQINTPLTKAEWAEAFAAARAGHLPSRLWSELYFQTAHDPSVAPEGVQTMSVFAQYVPHTFADNSSWDTRRDEVTALAMAMIGRFCTNIPEALLHVQTLGPPDIEQKVGLHGGHIFQGECLPDQMWDRRLPCATPMPGLYLCGAGTHPGGSVIGVNGRNAAMAILASGPGT
jgi:phytoene dehydrogenase-like protein